MKKTLENKTLESVCIYEGDLTPPEQVRIQKDGLVLHFVQLYIDDLPILRAEDNFHPNILEKTLNEFDWGYDIIKNRFYQDSPALSGKRYKTVGMGVCVTSGSDSILFSDGCMEYDIGIDQRHFDAVRALIPYEEIEFQTRKESEKETREREKAADRKFKKETKESLQKREREFREKYGQYVGLRGFLRRLGL